MTLSYLDWSAIAGYLLITLILGLYFRRKSSRSTEDYFVSGRQVSWWLAGTSMVATTFAADTPLLVSGLVATQGIAGNWIWWSMCLSGMLTVFFFARYWRRAEVLTDVELAELRYSGRPAAFLRGFKAKQRTAFVRDPNIIMRNVPLPQPEFGDAGRELHPLIRFPELSLVSLQLPWFYPGATFCRCLHGNRNLRRYGSEK